MCLALWVYLQYGDGSLVANGFFFLNSSVMRCVTLTPDLGLLNRRFLISREDYGYPSSTTVSFVFLRFSHALINHFVASVVIFLGWHLSLLSM